MLKTKTEPKKIDSKNDDDDAEKNGNSGKKTSNGNENCGSFETTVVIWKLKQTISGDKKIETIQERMQQQWAKWKVMKNTEKKSKKKTNKTIEIDYHWFSETERKIHLKEEENIVWKVEE